MDRLIMNYFPLYWLPSLDGATAGCKVCVFCALFHVSLASPDASSLHPPMSHRSVFFLQLVDETLQLFDPELSQHLAKHQLECVIYGFSCVLSLSSPAPPFEELMVLWDFLFAYGVHWNVLAVVAQVLLIREQVLASETCVGAPCVCCPIINILQSSGRSLCTPLYLHHQTQARARLSQVAESARALGRLDDTAHAAQAARRSAQAHREARDRRASVRRHYWSPGAVRRDAGSRVKE